MKKAGSKSNREKKKKGKEKGYLENKQRAQGTFFIKYETSLNSQHSNLHGQGTTSMTLSKCINLRTVWGRAGRTVKGMCWLTWSVVWVLLLQCIIRQGLMCMWALLR